MLERLVELVGLGARVERRGEGAHVRLQAARLVWVRVRVRVRARIRVRVRVSLPLTLMLTLTLTLTRTRARILPIALALACISRSRSSTRLTSPPRPHASTAQPKWKAVGVRPPRCMRSSICIVVRHSPAIPHACSGFGLGFALELVYSGLALALDLALTLSRAPS